MDWAISILTIISSIAASSGFWAWLQRRDTRKSAITQLLLGLAHDRIVFLGMSYLERGWITKDEYEDFMKYLWGPYSSFGGNGLADKVVRDVKNLPMQGAHRATVRVPKDKYEQPNGEPSNPVQQYHI